MSISEILMNRRSIRKYSEQEVPLETLKEIISKARYSPTASNQQAWEFIAVTDKQMLGKVTQYASGIWRQPPALIAICMDKQRAEQRAGLRSVQQHIYYDAGIASYAISLLAMEYGLGSCIIASVNLEAMPKVLHLPERLTPLLLVTLGYTNADLKTPEKRLRPLKEVLFFDFYGRQDVSPDLFEE